FITHGYVVSVREKGALIGFYNNMRGWLPIQECSYDFVRTMEDILRVGQVVKVRVLNTDAKYEGFTVSLLLSPRSSNSRSIKNAASDVVIKEIAALPQMSF